MKETKPVGRLWDQVQHYLDRQDFRVSERQLAAKLGYASSSTFDGWRNPKSLPQAQALARFAQLSHLPYQRVLEAALEDVGYLPEPALTEEPIGFRRRQSEGLDWEDRRQLMDNIEPGYADAALGQETVAAHDEEYSIEDEQEWSTESP